MSGCGITRRHWLGCVAAVICGRSAFGSNPTMRVSPFAADVTPPIGHPLLGGWITPARSIRDRLEAKGLVIEHGTERWVLCALDWCELRNDAYERFRAALARSVGTSADRVLLACVHQHDAPYADWHAQDLLDHVGLVERMFQRDFFLAAVRRVADAAAAACTKLTEVDRIGVGSATVEQVASNRRVVLPNGDVRYARGSFVTDLRIRLAPEGEIDPKLRMISFWQGDRPVAAVCSYAVHPMSRYGQGNVSGDFPAEARRRWERAHPGVSLLYFTGAAGDTTASRYNDGTEQARRALAERLTNAMDRAWQDQQPVPPAPPRLTTVPVSFQPDGPGHRTEEEYRQLLARPGNYFRQVMAALTLSWFRRCRRREPVRLSLLEFGPQARFLLLPAEAFVAFQLEAHRLWNDGKTVVAAYGECAPGYIPTERARQEGFAANGDYCWVAPGAERVLKEAMARLRKRSSGG